MLVDEARICARLVHPNIVSVIDFDRDAERRLFLVMELVEGKDLDELAQTGLLPVPVVVHIIAEVLRGLGHAHELPAGSDIRGVVHRDVSPHNVLLSWDGAVKVSDFGIAKARSASEASASVFIKGKPSYMSPEQAHGNALDGRSDLFAVGIVVWELLTGRRLFVGEDTKSTLSAVLYAPIQRPRSLRPELGKDLDRVVMTLLARDLPARYPNAEAALRELLACKDAPTTGREALAACLAERFPADAPLRPGTPRSGARPAAAFVRPEVSSDADTVVSTGDAATVPAAPPMPRQPSPRRSRRIAIAVATVVAGAAIGIGAVSLGRCQADTARAR
jgi:serine/threonine protein kinase